MNGQWRVMTPPLELSEVGRYRTLAIERPASIRDYSYPYRGTELHSFRIALHF